MQILAFIKSLQIQTPEPVRAASPVPAPSAPSVGPAAAATPGTAGR